MWLRYTHCVYFVQRFGPCYQSFIILFHFSPIFPFVPRISDYNSRRHPILSNFSTRSGILRFRFPIYTAKKPARSFSFIFFQLPLVPFSRFLGRAPRGRPDYSRGWCTLSSSFRNQASTLAYEQISTSRLSSCSLFLRFFRSISSNGRSARDERTTCSRNLRKRWSHGISRCESSRSATRYVRLTRRVRNSARGDFRFSTRSSAERGTMTVSYFQQRCFSLHLANSALFTGLVFLIDYSYSIKTFCPAFQSAR